MGTDPWWRVTFPKPLVVRTVRVTNRGDCCTDRLSGSLRASKDSCDPKSGLASPNQIANLSGLFLDFIEADFESNFLFCSIFAIYKICSAS